jgi:hypothetical protein
VKTRFVISCSAGESVFHDWMSLDSGIFSGSQKLPVRRSQTSRSFSSSILFQLIASNTGVWRTLVLLLACWLRAVRVGPGGNLVPE